MTWNYRVVKRTFTNKDGSTEDRFAVHEVYYDDNDPPKAETMISLDPTYPSGDSVGELRRDFEYYQRALDKPVLIWEDFQS